MKINKWILGLIVISIVGTLVVYPKLPQIIPIHWGANGEIDGYGNKLWSIFLAVLPMFLLGLLLYLPKIDPKREAYTKHKKAYEIFTNMLMVFLIFLHWVSVTAALGYEINVGMVVAIAVGVLFIGTGNYMRQIRHNYFFGIRTPWTLASEKVWVKTHRLGGWLFIISGLLFVLTGLCQFRFGFQVSITFLITSIVYLYFYSYLVFKKTSD